MRVNASKKRRRMLWVLSYNKELETEKLMKEKEQKFRDDFKGIDRAKITKKQGAFLGITVSIVIKRWTRTSYQRSGI